MTLRISHRRCEIDVYPRDFERNVDRSLSIRVFAKQHDLEEGIEDYWYMMLTPMVAAGSSEEAFGWDGFPGLVRSVQLTL